MNKSVSPSERFAHLPENDETRPRKVRCLNPFRWIEINQGGIVTPCCSPWFKGNLGNALEQNLDPRKTLMIGDTVHDAEVAAAMGIDCWLVRNGHQDRERLEATGVPVLDRLGNIPDRLKESRP